MANSDFLNTFIFAFIVGQLFIIFIYFFILRGQKQNKKTQK